MPALPGLPSPPSQAGPPVRPRAGDGAGDPQRDLLPPRTPPTDPWALRQGPCGSPGRPAWAESGWGDGALWGPSGSGEGAARARARAELCGVFPAQQVDRVMALFPALSDVARLTLLIRRLRRCGGPVGNP